jgi:hypothetical protein
MRTTGIRGSSIPSRNVGCATVVQSPPRKPLLTPFIDAVTDIAGASQPARDHGLSSVRPNCPAPTTGWDRWPTPLLIRLSWMWRRSRNGYSDGRVPRAPDRASTLVNACTRPHLAPHLPLMCERGPLPGPRAHLQFACKGSLLILRRPLRAAPTSGNVTSGDHLHASRTKITTHPTS